MRRAACCLVLAACRFSAPEGAGPDGTNDPEAAPPSGWWDAAYHHRRRLVVTTGPVKPDKGYAGYTVRLGPFDPAAGATALDELAASCDDLRVVTFDGRDWTERPRHVLACGTDAMEVRFALPIDLPDTTTWRDAYVYYGRAGAPAPQAATGSAVYLWWDDAAANRATDYTHGRMDAWLGTNHHDSFRWSAGDRAYGFDTGDDSQESLRRTVDERDVLVEAEFFHSGCYLNNMQSSVCARVVIASGSGASEQANHYYCTSRGQNPMCNNTDQGIYDGDIVKTDNEIIALQGQDDPPALVPNQWRKQALAVFGAGPTHLRFWDADASWPGLATPPDGAIQARGDDGTAPEYTGRGAAGVMIVQDIGRLRNLVIRRYTEPEPRVELLEEETAP